MFSSRLNKEGMRVYHKLCQVPSQDGRLRGQKHRFYMVYPPNTTPVHFVRCCYLPLDFFGLVCECIRAEYPRTVGILTSNVGRKLDNVDMLIFNT
jgi:hypothetical protein